MRRIFQSPQGMLDSNGEPTDLNSSISAIQTQFQAQRLDNQVNPILQQEIEMCTDMKQSLI